tara:strand:- start:242 stop:460 length:219 start_codon:yes stop_codon:yes gene_type:complete
MADTKTLDINYYKKLVDEYKQKEKKAELTLAEIRKEREHLIFLMRNDLSIISIANLLDISRQRVYKIIENGN